MSVGGYKIRDQYGIHFLTFTICGWVDVFTRIETKTIIVDSLKYCIENKGLILYSYVIMTNHIHIIAKAKSETSGLSDLIRDFKKYTANKLIDWICNNPKESRREWMQMVFKYHAKFNGNNSTYQIWEQKNRPKEIVLPRFGRQKLNYIHQNPVRADFVDKLEHYKYSSYRNYYAPELELLLPVSILTFGVEEGYIHVLG